MYNVIVVGADDSPTALEAVRQAIGFAKMSGGTLHFVTAYKPKPPGNVDVPDEFRYSMASTHDADVLLRRLTDLARAEGVDSEVHAVTSDPADALIDRRRPRGCRPDRRREQGDEGRPAGAGERAELRGTPRHLLGPHPPHDLRGTRHDATGGCWAMNGTRRASGGYEQRRLGP